MSFGIVPGSLGISSSNLSGRLCTLSGGQCGIGLLLGGLRARLCGFGINFGGSGLGLKLLSSELESGGISLEALGVCLGYLTSLGGCFRSFAVGLSFHLEFVQLSDKPDYFLCFSRGSFCKGIQIGEVLPNYICVRSSRSLICCQSGDLTHQKFDSRCGDDFQKHTYQ